jgi:hypothetical protein
MKYRRILIISLILSLFFLRNNIYAKGENFSNLEVSPVLNTLNLNRGQRYKGFITLINRSNTKQYISIGVSGFRQYKETNKPLFSSKINSISKSIHWFIIQNSSTIKPFQSIKIPYSIIVPSNASSGGHFAAITIDQRNKFSKIIESIRPLFIINIKGNINISGFIKKFSTDNLFNFSPNIQFSTTFENTGNIEFAPYGFIIIKNIFGQVVKIIPINTKKSLDLPESTRLYKSEFIDNNFFNTGVYSAQLILSFGNTAKVYNINKFSTFYIINPYFSILLIIIMFSIIIYISLKIKNEKKYF